MIRRIYSQFCLGLLEKKTRGSASYSMNDSAVIFSPHYDDETLGIGGTIIQKCSAGAPVYIVFMTDGSRSHVNGMDGSRLSALRRNEALHAAAALGVPETHVRFLNFPEMRLQDYHARAVDAVAELLVEFDCRQVFVPSGLEPLVWSADHNATTEIVFRALSRLNLQPEIVEYLVWFWYHWPWVSIRRGADVRQLLKLSWRNRFGLNIWRRLNTAVSIQEVQTQKRIALEQYKSQMTRLRQDIPWPILSDVGQGEFLERFFQPKEFFKRYKYAEGLTL